VVDVADRPDVDVRLRSLKDFLRHCGCSKDSRGRSI
jgi:hypothetical protein